MKRPVLAALMLTLPNLAFAHETGPAHIHPHSDGNVMLVLATVVIVAGAVVFARQMVSARAKKDDHHDPR
ncbi:MAG: hypothetical protein ACE360_11895 [Hyphomicrobiales bacterium]